jgi:tripartite-type tricarboxylate transporter receptor subunit TctC
MLPVMKFVIFAFLLGAGLPGVTAEAQQYPARPVKMVVGFAAGSGPDVLARAVAAQLGTDLGQQFYVENRTGANGTLAINAVVQAEPDGHTLLFTSSSIAPIPHLYTKLPFDIVRDLAPVATCGILDGFLMLVHPGLPVRTVADFIAYAKKNRVLYGTPGFGNILHLVTELFRLRAGIEMEHIPYKGASEVANALLGQSIHVMFVTPPSVLSLAKEGKLRAIGYTASKPFPDLPDVPLIPDALPGYSQFGSWSMILAPARTPQPLIEKLNAAVQKAIEVPKVAGVLRQSGYFPDGRSAAQTSEFFRAELERVGAAVKAAGIQPN